MNNATAVFLLILSTFYLLNFSVGIFELPDYLPIVGNLDEAAATLIFISALKHFGIDLTALVLRKNKPSANVKA